LICDKKFPSNVGFILGLKCKNGYTTNNFEVDWIAAKILNLILCIVLTLRETYLGVNAKNN
jgi:hypothetical protein